MSDKRKITKQYVFTVEGETEQWYLTRLQNMINSNESSLYKVNIISKVQQNPRKYAKTVNPLSTPSVTHLCDYESNEAEHKSKFQNILSELHTANSTIGRKFKYSLGYCNFTFELWMILHKQDCNGRMTNRNQYLKYINTAYGEAFENLDKYKSEANLKRCLSKLTLNDVCSAINRAKHITDIKTENGELPVRYKGFSYYTENPALTIWESIEKILNDCGISLN